MTDQTGVVGGGHELPVPAQPVRDDTANGPSPKHRFPVIAVGLVVGVLVVTLAVGGAFWYLRKPSSATKATATTDNAAAEKGWNVVDFAGAPGLTWQVDVSQLGLGLDCMDASGGSGCPATSAGTTKTLAVVAVSDGTRGEVVGLDRATGKKSWQRSLGGEPSCTVDDVTVWCLVTSATSTGSDGAPTTTEVAGLDAQTGALSGEVPVPGGANLIAQAPVPGPGPGGTANLVAYDSGAAYVASFGNRSTVGGDTTNSTVTVSKINSHAKVVWQQVLNVSSNDEWKSTKLQVVGDMVYLDGVESNGDQVQLKASDGGLISAGPGQVAEVVDGTTITRQGSTDLRIGKTVVAQSTVLTVEASDGRSGLPLLLSAGASTPDQSEVGSIASFTAVDAKDPSKTLFQVSGFVPLAYCGGTLFVSSASISADGSALGSTGPATIEALDPTTGAVKWQRSVEAARAWCSGDGLVVGGPQQVSELAGGTGATTWRVPVAAGATYDPASRPGTQHGVLVFSGAAGSQTISYID